MYGKIIMNNYKKENKILDALIYIIMIATLIMLAPLIARFANNYSLNSPVVLNEGESISERVTRNRRYTVTETKININALKYTEFGALNLMSAKIADCGTVIMFCESPLEDADRPGSTTRIAVWNSGEINVFERRIRSGLYDSILNRNYVYKDYGDGTVFISNNMIAFLFDFEELKYVEHYMLPDSLNIYQAVLSNNKDRLAVAAEEGFFIYDIYPQGAPLKELIASSSSGGVLITAREPVWAAGDDYIFYKSYADNFIRNAGMTTDSPGGNEQLAGLDSTNFLFIKGGADFDNDMIFYYFSSGSEPYQENLFRCGFFNPFGDRRMAEIMKSQVYYFDIDISPRGTHLAALSHNGNVIRINIIDIRTKKQIYSAMYEAVYDFSFSPDERNFIIHAMSEGEEILKFIEIDWIEE